MRKITRSKDLRVQLLSPLLFSYHLSESESYNIWALDVVELDQVDESAVCLQVELVLKPGRE